jgi:hypothetical protein
VPSGLAHHIQRNIAGIDGVARIQAAALFMAPWRTSQAAHRRSTSRYTR